MKRPNISISRTFGAERSRRLLVTAGLATGVFLLDLATPQGFAEEMLYTGVVFFATQTLPRRLVLLVSSCCTILTILGFWLSPPGFPERVSISNRGFTIAAIWAIVLLALQRKRAEAQLRSKEDQVRLVVQQVRDYGIVMLDPQGRVASWNAGAEWITGFSAKQVLGREFSTLFLPADVDRQRARSLLAMAAASGQAEDEGWRLRRDSSRFWAHVAVTVLHDESGALQGFATVTQDLTARKEAEDAIRNLIRISQKLNSSMDLERLIDELVGEALQLLGAEGGFAALARTEGIVAQKYFRGSVPHTFRRTWRPGQGLPGWALTHKAPYLTNDTRKDPQIEQDLREELDIRSAITVPILDFRGDVMGVMEIHNGRDSHGFTKSDEAKLLGVAQAASIAIQNALTYRTLQRTEAMHVHLLDKIMAAQENERRRISRELHDEIGQSLTSLLVGLRTIEETGTDRLVRARAMDLRRITVQTITEVQRLARGLRPSVLDDLGLQEAISRYVAEYKQAHAVHVDVHFSGLDDQRFPSSVETALYRIVQEALTNVAKHAEANTVSILLECLDSSIQLIVEDDGRGFPLDTWLQDPESSDRMGLQGMQERATLLNGAMTIESSPGMGTTIYVRIPLEKESA